MELGTAVLFLYQAKLSFVYLFLQQIFSPIISLLYSSSLRFAWQQDQTKAATFAKTYSKRGCLHITGIGAEWPTEAYGPETFEQYVRQHYDVTAPGISKLLHVNRKTGIESRRLLAPFGNSLWQDRARPPTIEQTDEFFREHATRLTVNACRKAVKEWGGKIKDITHTVAVTCTNAGSPGFDQEVVSKLGLGLDVDRTLLHGVGCSGGLAALRAAAQMAKAAGDQPACVLVFACEITSIGSSVELEDAERNSETSIGPILFSDGAAAFVLCNDAALSLTSSPPIYDLLDWTTMRVPNTESLMSYRLTQLGFKLFLSKEVPIKAAGSIWPAFKRMVKAFSKHGVDNTNPKGFDWALHPGGLSIIKGAEMIMGVSEDQLRASYEVYRNYGNTSSVAVLAVLDKLRTMGEGRDNVVACSFGPGLTVEMAALQRAGR